MSYCAVTDVGNLLGFTYSASTQPTTTQVQAIIDQVSAEIDVTLRRSGISSVTDSTSLDYLKLVCSKGAACYVGAVYFNNIQNTGGTISNFYCTSYKEDLKSILEDSSMISGASTFGASSNVTDGVTSEDDVNALFIGDNFRV